MASRPMPAENGTAPVAEFRRRRQPAGGPDLALCSERQPTLYKIIRRHAEAIVAEHQHPLLAEVVGLDPLGIGIVGVLE
jgi:hypothetical protein